MIKLALSGLPLSVNKSRTNLRTAMRVQGDYHREVYAQLYDLGVLDLGLGSKARPLHVDLRYVMGPRSRNRDTVSNMEKAALDALQHAGVIANDRFVKSASVASAIGPEDRTLIKIQTIDPLTLDQLLAWYDD